MSKPDKQVVFVSQIFPPEKVGNASRIHDTAKYLQEDGWEVTVLAPPPCYPPGEFQPVRRKSFVHTVNGILVRRLWAPQPTSENPGLTQRLPYYVGFALHAALWLLVNVGNYRVVVTSTPPITTGLPGLLASIVPRCKWVVDVRDLWIDNSVSLGYIPEGGLLERIARRFQRTVLTRADAITVTTDTLGKAVRFQYGYSLGEKTFVQPNGVDISQFDFRPRTDERDEENPVIIYTGNLGSAQDLETCIEAMRELETDATLQLVGRGDLESRLQELTVNLGLEDHIEFHGPVPREEVPTLLNEATVGIAPLKRTDELAYAIPTKAYEYLAAGLPTVVTGKGEIERLIQESGGGEHAMNDPSAVAAALDRLLTDAGRRETAGRRGYEHVRERFDRRHIASELGSYLDRLIGGT